MRELSDLFQVGPAALERFHTVRAQRGTEPQTPGTGRPTKPQSSSPPAPPQTDALAAGESSEKLSRELMKSTFLACKPHSQLSRDKESHHSERAARGRRSSLPF